MMSVSGGNTEKAHLLKSVINNIELCGTYYQEATLSFVAYDGDALLRKYQEYLTDNGSN